MEVCKGWLLVSWVDETDNCNDAANNAANNDPFRGNTRPLLAPCGGLHWLRTAACAQV